MKSAARIPIPFVQSGSYPTRTGNSVRPLIDGLAAFRRICEAIDAARTNVWVTITFLWESFAMPDARGMVWDVLDRAAARGVDVRLICWRPDDETEWLRCNTFWGAPEQITYLERRRSGVNIRWDCAPRGFCQHQKSWLIDAGTDDGVAFVGGINLNPNSMVAPGHSGERQNHDVYIEFVGPSVVDIHHNFVLRWNEASERANPGGRWGRDANSNLHFPEQIPAMRGNAIVQVQRTLPVGSYRDGHATPGGRRYEVAAGERTNFDQYCAAIEAASRTIYIENQNVDVGEVVECLRHALARGVIVVLLMPAEPQVRSPISSEREKVLRERRRLGHFENFFLAGAAGIGSDGRRNPVYVHSKLMLVDDTWATVGSCNLHRLSLFGNSEMNVAFSELGAVRRLRSQLLSEHLDEDTSSIEDIEALRRFCTVAKANRRRLDAGDPAWQGIVFQLDLAEYVG